MYIYKLTQEYVKVRKLGQDFKDFIWRGLRIHPLRLFQYFMYYGVRTDFSSVFTGAFIDRISRADDS